MEVYKSLQNSLRSCTITLFLHPSITLQPRYHPRAPYVFITCRPTSELQKTRASGLRTTLEPGHQAPSTTTLRLSHRPHPGHRHSPSPTPGLPRQTYASLFHTLYAGTYSHRQDPGHRHSPSPTPGLPRQTYASLFHTLYAGTYSHRQDPGPWSRLDQRNTGQLVYVDSFVSARDDQTGAQVIVGLTDFGDPRARELFNCWEGLWRDVGTVPLELCHALDEDALTKMGYSFGDMVIIQRLALAYGAFCAANLKPGQAVIIAPATSAHSGAVVELASQLGCHVMAVTRSASKLRPLMDRHSRVTAVEISGRSSEEISAAILAECPPSGADAYIDLSPPVPGVATWFEPSLAAVRRYGHVILLGMPVALQIDLIKVMIKNINVKAQCMYTRQQAADVVRMVESGILKLGKDAGHEVVAQYDLEQWEEAVAAAEDVSGWGKHILFGPWHGEE